MENKPCCVCGFEFEEDEHKIYYELYEDYACEMCIRNEIRFELITANL